MSIGEAVILGIVQGLGEFLPISSSAHLVLVPWFAGWPYAGLTFDVALHIGTLLAVVGYFWRDWLVLLADGLRRAPTVEGRLFWYVVVATIPGALFGYFLEEQAETVFREPFLIGLMLMLMGIVLYLVDSRAPKWRKLGQIGLADSILIGVSQALAIIPGISRAGVTMTAGRFLGLEREAAARFSFLLSAPIISGAGLMQLSKITPSQVNAPFLTGIVVSAVVGFLSIGFLLRYLTRHSFVVFVWYRLLLGAVVILFAFLR
ncbi:MAG: undecaprenyl-diphosphate phosphatase [Bacillota bacterium]